MVGSPVVYSWVIGGGAPSLTTRAAGPAAGWSFPAKGARGRVRIRLNGEPREIEDGLTVARLVESLGLGGGRVAVAVNAEVVPRGEHAAHVLRDGDNVEIIHAVAGG